MTPSDPPDAADTLISRDSFLGGRLSLRQPAHGYRAGIDPVMLAAMVTARPGDTVLDLGCGVGTAGLCLLARLPGLTVSGLEVQPDLAALARANATENGMAHALTIHEGSMLRPPDAICGRAFDHVITNPPWYESAAGRAPSTATKRIGHQEGDADLATWLKLAVRALRPKGSLALIHRADRLGDLLTVLTALPVGGIRIFPLFPKSGRPAIRVLLTARKGTRIPLELARGMILHEEDGRYTNAAETVLREAGVLAVRS